MQYDQAHAAHDPLPDGGNYGIANIVLHLMAAPGQDIRPLQGLVAEGWLGRSPLLARTLGLSR